MGNERDAVALFAGDDGGSGDVETKFCSLAFTEFGVEIVEKFTGGN